MKTVQNVRLKVSLKIFFFAMLLFAGSSWVSAQTISSYLLGNNYWYPGGALNEVMKPGGLMDQADFQTIRIGGFGPNDYSDAQYLEYIRRIKGMGAKPIVQVRASLTTQQAIDFIKLVNQTNGLGVKVWSIGNEPDHAHGGNLSDGQIADYTKRIAAALKSVDPTITVVALEFAGYSGTRYANLIGGANSVTGLVPGKDYYYVDVVAFHRYVITDASQLLGSINDLVGKVNAANAGRPAGKKLMWGMGEFNSHYNNDATGDPDMKVWSFNNGQFHAELYGIGMQKGAFSLDSWSTLEGPDRSGTDLSLFDKNYAGRSNYYHSLMLGQNMKQNYRTSTDNQASVAIVAMGDGSGTAVMIINKSKTTGYNYSLNLNNATPGANALTISVNAGINKEITGNIGATATQMLVFNTSGNLVKRYTYTKANADARSGPKVEVFSTTNNAPTVTLTAPANNTNVNVNTAVTVSANASDPDGTVTKVDFYAGATLIGTDTSSPYSISWTPTTAGTYAVTAKATDNDGASTTSAASSLIVKTAGTNHPIPGKIEAEAFSAMQGIQTEATTDAGGGQNIGYVDAGDWLDYNVDVNATGKYNVSFRVASQVATGAFQLKAGATVLAAVAVPNTGGWQTWQTVTIPVNLTQGIQTLRIQATGAGINMNWLNFAVASNAIKIEAESYTSMFGIQTQATTDTGGGLNVGYTEPGDWMNYSVAIATAGVYTVNFRVASLVTTGKIELRNAAGTTLATLAQGSTGGWQTWVTKSVTATLPAGTQTLRIYYTGAGLNINWFELVEGGLKSSEIGSEIGTISKNVKLEVYPNPVVDELHIQNVDQNSTIEIFNLSGKLVLTKKLDSVNNTISVSNLKSGLYFINTKGNDKSSALKFIKK